MNVNHEDIYAIIKGSGVAADVSALKGDMPFKQAGIDSLEMMNVFLSIEQKYNLKIKDDEMDGLNTVDAIVRFLQSR